MRENPPRRNHRPSRCSGRCCGKTVPAELRGAGTRRARISHVSRVACSRWCVALSSVVLGLAGCGSTKAPAPAATVVTPQAPVQTRGEAHRLVIATASCWLGGLWSDALGERLEARSRGIQMRCDQVLQTVFGAVNPLGYAQLRALEPRIVDDIATQVRILAARDDVDRKHAEDLVKLLLALSDAQRENVLARDAADDVKRDEEIASTHGERMIDKAQAGVLLRRTAGIEALLSRKGDLEHEARGLGLLCALDRLEISRRLPKHLKVYAVGGPFERVFGVAPPPVSDDPTAPIPTGEWPGYLAAVAAAAGHPVPEDATQAIDRETLAWGGVLAGFAERLRVEARAVPGGTALPDVLYRVAMRLDQEHATLLELFHNESAQRR
jgi:hypothetical protein